MRAKCPKLVAYLPVLTIKFKVMSNILSAKAFNEMQNKAYKEYCEKCILNGVQPQSQQSGFFYKMPVKYGYVQFNSKMNNITWKKRKSDFS